MRAPWVALEILWKTSPRKIEATRGWGWWLSSVWPCGLERGDGQFATWRTSQDWYWKTMHQHDWKLWFEESQACNPWWELLYHREGEHYFLSVWINWIKPPIHLLCPCVSETECEMGLHPSFFHPMGLEKESFDRGDKILFANVCDCHGFYLGFAFFLQILLHFSSQIFSPDTANLLCAEMQYRKYLECKNKAVFPTF